MQQNFDQKLSYLSVPDSNVRPADIESHLFASAPQWLESKLVAQSMLDLAVLKYLIKFSDTKKRNFEKNGLYFEP